MLPTQLPPSTSFAAVSTPLPPRTASRVEALHLMQHQHCPLARGELNPDIPELLMVDSGCPVQGGGKGRLTNVKTT